MPAVRTVSFTAATRLRSAKGKAQRARIQSRARARVPRVCVFVCICVSACVREAASSSRHARASGRGKRARGRGAAHYARGDSTTISSAPTVGSPFSLKVLPSRVLRYFAREEEVHVEYPVFHLSRHPSLPAINRCHQHHQYYTSLPTYTTYSIGEVRDC